ncbi:MAG: response regulator transcription factor [Thermoguttaceae bacterium]|nr:response regulator transcription factor [Thermoguttaceae bacterium]
MTPAARPKVLLSVLCGCRLMREALVRRLAREAGISVVASGATLHDLLAAPGVRNTQVLVINDDAHAWPMFVDATAILPSAEVVMLVDDHDLASAVRYIEAGARACVEHSASLALLVQAIEAAAQGRSVASGAMVACVIRRLHRLPPRKTPVRRDGVPALTDREAEVLRLVAEGLSNKQIARWLRIKISTVKTFVHQILKKLHVRRRRDVLLRSRGIEV